MLLLNKEEAELLLTFPDDVAKSVLSKFEYNVFCILRDAAITKYPDIVKSGRRHE